MKCEVPKQNQSSHSCVEQASNASLSCNVLQLERLLDSLPALIAFVDETGCYRWVNREYRIWYGLGADELVGQRALDVLRDRIGPEYAEQLRPHVERALAGEEATFEATHHYGGRRHDLLLSYRPDRDADGKVRGFALLVTDLTEQRQISRALEQSEQHLRTLTEMLPSMIWTATPQGELDYISPQFAVITGLSSDSGLGLGWMHLVHPEDLSAVMEGRFQSISTGSMFETKCRLRVRGGSYRWYLIRGLPERNGDGEIIRWLGIATDVQTQVQAEETARASEERYRLLFEDNPIPMWTYNTKTLQILTVNDVAVKRYGYTRDEWLHMRLSEIRPPEDALALVPVMHEPPEGSPVGPIRHKRKDGSVFWVEVTCHSLTGGDPDTRIVVAKDVSEQVRLHAELVQRANYDPLTGLPNRRLLIETFDRKAQRAKEAGQRLAVLAIDFDRFKQVNDTFGHRVGDEFLKASASKLSAVLPDSATLARVGGDEFTVLADCIESSDECSEIADRMIETLNEPLLVGDSKLQSSISVGIAFYPDHGEDLDEILRRADFGLYHAKRLGGACWSCYSPSQIQGIQEALEIEKSLRKALVNGQFELHYQPIVSPSGVLRGLEALVRFPHPTLGLLPPSRFIPVAEESGLIVPMGMWVLRQTCQQLRKWRNAGLGLVPIAVNVSAVQFRRGNLANDITTILKEFDIEPELLGLELTESLLMENTEHSWHQLGLLKRAGVQIAVDDFGTGYSSLSYLHRLPLDRLKIDRSFVAGTMTGGSNPIVRAIVELGKALNLSVVAEGVESESQLRELTKMGCDLVQGFLFSAPRPAEEINGFLMPQALNPGLFPKLPTMANMPRLF